MGRQSYKLQCIACQHEFWQKLEHLEKHELLAYIEDVDCPECGHGEWEFLDQIDWAGSQKTWQENQEMLCSHRDCQEEVVAEFGIDLHGMTRTQMKKEVELTVCPYCGSDDWELRDSVYDAGYFDI